MLNTRKAALIIGFAAALNVLSTANAGGNGQWWELGADGQWRPHCLGTGTRITLASGETVAVENLTDPQVLLASAALPASTLTGNASNIDFKTVPAGINEFYSSAYSDQIYTLVDTLGNTLVATGFHPIVTQNKGVISVAELQVGDVLFTRNGPSQVKGLSKAPYTGGKVYNFGVGTSATKAQHLGNFYANNILVGDLDMQKAITK